MDAQEQGRLTMDADPRLTGAAPTDGAGVIANAFYTSEYHRVYELISIGALDLEHGGHIPDCRLAATTSGELNEARHNAILISHPLAEHARDAANER
jgi:homoserine acetyltransferase